MTFLFSIQRYRKRNDPFVRNLKNELDANSAWILWSGFCLAFHSIAFLYGEIKNFFDEQTSISHLIRRWKVHSIKIPKKKIYVIEKKTTKKNPHLIRVSTIFIRSIKRNKIDANEIA